MNFVQIVRVAAVAAAVHASLECELAAQTPSSPPVTDPLALELQRCRDIGEKAGSDARCQAAYKQSRDQFLAPSKPYEPGAVHMNPDTPKPKLIKPDQQPTPSSR